MRRDCKLDPKLDVQMSNSSRENLVEVENSYVDGDILSLVHGDSIKDQWILDSRTSFYLTARENWFHTYHLCNKTIYMCDELI